MLTTQLIQNIPCEITPVNSEVAQVTFTLPVSYINDFVIMLSSMVQLFRGLGWKAKTNIDLIHSRTDERKAEIAEMNDRYEKACISTFKKYLETSSNPREALSLTVSSVSGGFPFSSYDLVKNCLSKNKLLKNTGFYKSRHKIA